MRHLRLTASLLPLAAMACLSPAPTAQKIQAFDMAGARMSAGRIFYDGEGFPGAFSITWGAPVWKPEYAAMLDREEPTGPQRLGANYWTNFDNSLPMEMGGAGRLPVGNWYLAIERVEGGAIHLLFFDGALARKKKQMPFPPFAIEPAHRFPVTLKKTDAEVERLSFRTTLSEDDPMRGSLSLHWGPYVASTAWRAVPAPAANPRKAAFDDAVAGMLRMIERGEVRGLIETYAHPEDLAQIGDIDEAAARMKRGEGGKLEILADALRAVQEKDLAVAEGQSEVEFEFDRGPDKPIRFAWAAGGWKLRN